MKISCPNCGKPIVVNTGGRKKKNITSTEVCTVVTLKNNEKPWWAETARSVFREYGVEVSGQLVQIRVKRYLAENNITLGEFLAPLVAEKRQKRIREKMNE